MRDEMPEVAQMFIERHPWPKGPIGIQEERLSCLACS